jgi:hypothetical protein
MNTPKLTFTIIRPNYFYSYNDTNAIVVGKYQLAHIENMQEFLSQEDDVTSYNKNISDLDMKLPDFMFDTEVEFDL